MSAKGYKVEDPVTGVPSPNIDLKRITEFLATDAGSRLLTVIGESSDGVFGTKADEPLADGTITDDTPSSIVTLLKSIVNNTESIEVTLENNGTIEVAVDDLESYIGALNVAKVTNPDAASASSNALLRGILEALNKISGTGAVTDSSGTIAAANVSQLGRVSNSTRKFFMIQNPNQTGDIYYNFGSAASTTVAGSFRLLPGGSTILDGNFIPTAAINVTGTITGMQYTLKTA